VLCGRLLKEARLNRQCATAQRCDLEAGALALIHNQRLVGQGRRRRRPGPSTRLRISRAWPSWALTLAVEAHQIQHPGAEGGGAIHRKPIGAGLEQPARGVRRAIGPAQHAEQNDPKPDLEKQVRLRGWYPGGCAFSARAGPGICTQCAMRA